MRGSPEADVRAVAESRPRRVAVISMGPPSAADLPTFIQSHIRHFSGGIPPIHGTAPTAGDEPLFARWELFGFKLRRRLLREPAETQLTAGYIRAFQRFKPDAVLAEYGEVGVRVMDACARLALPLVVHFHGFDASVHAVLEANKETYPRLFRQAAAVIGVSREMMGVLEELGCPAEKLHHIPCGVDCEKFSHADPGNAPPGFLAVGRLVEKKGPLATIAAFKGVANRTPQATLRIIGEGGLRAACEQLIQQLRLQGSVTLLGAQPPEVVSAEMRAARAFVQHSLQASTGNREGTPVAVMEAGASGLPAVATRHAGIPEVVVHGATGLLVDEGDVVAMTSAMQQLADDPALAARLGRAARERVCAEFTSRISLGRLGAVLDAAAGVRAGRSHA